MTNDGGSIDLHEVFLRVQDQMLANLAAAEVFDHPTARGTTTEQHWIDLLNHYLPDRYRAGSAFIVDADGLRSRQIDIAVYDRFYSPFLFHHDSEPHIPAESVYAVFEVKPVLRTTWIADAGAKAASVRRLRRTSVPFPVGGVLAPAREPAPILAGILSLSTNWAGPFADRLAPILRELPYEERLDLGCCLRHGAFELAPAPDYSTIHFSQPEEALIYFILRLLHRLQRIGAAPAIDLHEYSRCLQPHTISTPANTCTSRRGRPRKTRVSADLLDHDGPPSSKIFSPR